MAPKRRKVGKGKVRGQSARSTKPSSPPQSAPKFGAPYEIWREVPVEVGGSDFISSPSGQGTGEKVTKGDIAELDLRDLKKDARNHESFPRALEARMTARALRLDDRLPALPPTDRGRTMNAVEVARDVYDNRVSSKWVRARPHGEAPSPQNRKKT